MQSRLKNKLSSLDLSRFRSCKTATNPALGMIAAMTQVRVGDAFRAQRKEGNLWRHVP